MGYRVWYDVNEMGYDLQKSMRDGITNSRVVLVCASQTYQTRENCMFELQEAVSSEKQLLTVILDQNPFNWASRELTDLCQLKSKLFISIAEFENEDWTSDDSPSPELLQRLRLALEPLVKVLINDFSCKPSLNKKELDEEENNFSLTEEMRPLDSLSIEEVSALLESLNLQKYIPKLLEFCQNN